MAETRVSDLYIKYDYRTSFYKENHSTLKTAEKDLYKLDYNQKNI